MSTENKNYANQKDGCKTLGNTGANGDERCHINDMAGNAIEWTTELSLGSDGDGDYPCVARGGICEDEIAHTAVHYGYKTDFKSYYVGFRPLLYLK